MPLIFEQLLLTSVLMELFAVEYNHPCEKRDSFLKVNPAFSYPEVFFLEGLIVTIPIPELLNDIIIQLV